MNILDYFSSDVRDAGKLAPYIIAEVGVNHEGSMDTAKKLIELAQRGGAHAVKFQTYKADTLASKESPAYWDTSKETTRSQYELFSKHDKFWKREMVALAEYCSKVKIDFMSTPFDFDSIDFLDDLMSVYKISSSDLTNKMLIEKICTKSKPIILSTGASDLFEIQRTVGWIRKYDTPLALLHCILNYPTKDENANLARIVGLKESFPSLVVGYSDHTLPGEMENLLTASILGARILEKHFTHDKTLPGNDHYHSMDVEDLILFNKKLARLNATFGSSAVDYDKSEHIARVNARRSLVALVDISKGEAVSKAMLIPKRPESGIPAYEVDELIGRVAKEDIKEGAILQWAQFE